MPSRASSCSIATLSIPWNTRLVPMKSVSNSSLCSVKYSSLARSEYSTGQGRRARISAATKRKDATGHGAVRELQERLGHDQREAS